MNGQAMGVNWRHADDWQNEEARHFGARHDMSGVAVLRYVPQSDRISETAELKTVSGNPYAPEAEVPTSEFSPLHARFLAELKSRLETTLATGCSTEFEWEYSGSGDSVWKGVLVVPEFECSAAATSALAIIRDITAQKQMELRLRALASRRMADLEEERRRIAYELHDDLGQHLIALRMSLVLSAKRVTRENARRYEKNRSEVALVDAMIQTMRDISQSLRPTMLELGLVPALRWLTTRFSVHTGVRCTLRASGADADIPEDQKTAIFRIVQESMTNATRHGKAQQIDVVFTRERNACRLEVRDDGVGFDVGSMTKRGTLGLTGMQERAIGAGGKVGVWSRSGCGAVVRASFPTIELVRTGESASRPAVGSPTRLSN